MKSMTSPPRHTLLLLGAGAAIAAGAFIAHSGQDSSPALEERAFVPSHAPTSAEVSSREEGANDTHTTTENHCVFSKGQRHSYALSGHDVAAIEPLGFGLKGSASATEVESTYSGTLHTEVLEVSAGGDALLLAELADFDSSAVREDALLFHAFLFRVASDCSLEGFAHHAKLPTGYARIQQALLHDLTFHFPAGQGASPFEISDGLGTIGGDISLTQIAAPTILEKHASTLTPWSSGIGSLSAIDGYTARITLAESGWFQELTLSASYRGVGITSTRSLRASRQQRTPDAALERASRDTQDYVWADLLPITTPLEEAAPVSRRELRARDAIRDTPLEEVMTRMLARIDRPDANIQESWPELRTYLEARPEMIRTVADDLIADKIPPRATMGVFIALGNTRNLEAKQALEQIARDPAIASFDRVRAMFSLVDRPDVGDDFALELAALARPLAHSSNEAQHLVARHALLALGMMSGRRPQREDIKQIAVEAIKNALADSPEAIIASPAFGALMNVGDPELLSLLAHIPDHPDYSMREVAAVSMRRMPPEKTAEFTETWLRKERDWRVKLTLYHSLELQTFAAREMTSRPVLELAIADLEQRPGALTRKALVRLLGRGIQELPAEDPLRQRVEREFAAMIPLEVEKRTGLYLTLAPFLDAATLRAALTKNAQAPTHSTDQDPQQPSVVDPISNPIRSAQ